MTADRPTDPAAQGRDEWVVVGGSDRGRAVVTVVVHHHGSREDITIGRALAWGLPLPPPPVGEDVGAVGSDELQ